MLLERLDRGRQQNTIAQKSISARLRPWVPNALINFEQHPWLFCIPVVNVLALVGVVRGLLRNRSGRAFAASCANIGASVALFGVGLFPNLVIASDPTHSLTIHNAASSEKTLGIMLTIAIIGMPFVLTYTAAIYWTYRGKVKLDDFSY